MPSLRFSRDRRGYESTYLLHASRRRSGPDQPQLLYWFRTPPHVKIGRAAFDEDAIRTLEEQHPDVEFDWDRILTTKPPAAPETRDPREGRPARRPVREARRDQARPAPVAVATPTPPNIPDPVDLPSATPVEPPALAAPVPSPSIDPVVPVRAPEAEIVPTRRFVRVFDAPAEAASAVPSHHASEPSVAERLLGAEQLTVLRARYAEILARISARGGDPARLEALREQAASVNPDVWVTEADVAAGLSTVDATLSDLHRIVGRRRRRRRRRNDGRRGVAPASNGATIPAESGGPARDLEFAGDSDDDDEGPDDEGPAEG